MKELDYYIKKSEDYNFSKLDIYKKIDVIGNKINRQKGVYTVLITLSYYKLLNPTQDIRYHQKTLKNGFSGRSFDTRHVTPILKNKGFPSMSESGWLTRSLEQPFPYTLNYQGKISDVEVKKKFLEIIDFLESKPKHSENILLYLLFWGHEIKKRNHVPLIPLNNPEKITIKKVIYLLETLFNKNYKISGGSKLPVICFYSLYKLLCKQVKRFDNKKLQELGYHTTSDRTSKSSGDIEIMDGNQLFESIEIKYDIEIDLHIVNRVIEKIKKFNPKRYYILSTSKIKEEDRHEIEEKVISLKEKHGCQLIINGLIPTVNYYLRLIDNIEDFYFEFSSILLNDSELKPIHKNTWNQIVKDNLKK